MRSFRRLFVVTLLVLAACQEDKPPALPSPLSVVAEAPSVKADGTSTVVFDVSGSTLGPITVSTTRGTFIDTGDRQTVISGVAGSVELRTCDAMTAGCAGLVHVTATDGKSAVGAGTVTFVGFETCTNGVDDNGDGLVDCSDPDCAGDACVTSSGAVGACEQTNCVCHATASSEASCSDGMDDDCDGLVDCADSDCAAKSCNAAGGAVGTCTAAGTCACTPSGTVEGACGDGKDNDCDGAVDCADSDCASKACQTASGPGTCQSNVCVAAACTPTGAETCSGGVDEDCDGVIDCADPDCNGQTCSTAGFVCASGACTDLSSGYSLEIAPARTALPADGVAETNLSIRVLQGGKPAASASVSIATDLGTLVFGTTTGASLTATTDGAGIANVTFRASASAGRATITAALASPSLTATANIALPALGAIELPSGSTSGLQYTVMGVKGSGFREQNQLVVRVVDADQKPYPAGLAVRFEHRELAGSLLSRTPATDAACSAPCMYFVARTDDQGFARVNLYSGTKAGTLQVVASAQAGGDSRTFAIPTVAVIGARASASAFTVVCDPANVRGFQAHDCGTSLYPGQYTCVALLQDRYQNMLGTTTPVTFVSETSRTGQVTWTPAYDASRTGPEQADLGSATQIFSTLGGFLPEDVPPLAGEASWTGVDECSEPASAPLPRTHNPRDGVVTVIAVADGEEAFTDLDGNGVYDAGEPFVDLAEPFADYNDNNVQDPGEWFLDVNKNGAWDGPNDRWDEFTKIWTQTAIVYTGAPAGPFTDARGALGSRWVDLADWETASQNACAPTPTPAPFSVVAERKSSDATLPATTDAFVVIGSDRNLNRLAADTQYAVNPVDPAKVQTFYTGYPSYPDGTGFFYRYWACDQSGNCATRCAATGAAARCEMRTSVSAFTCGIAAGVNVVGGSDGSGAEAVEFTQVLDPETLRLRLSGTNCAEASETACDDGADNDCDGLVDCQDPDCGARTCLSSGAAGTCQAGACVPVCTPTATTETACSGTLDADCDGRVGCADSDCDGQVCGAAGFECVSSVCSDTSGQYTLELAPARTALPGTGSSVSVSVRVMRRGVVVPSATVALSATGGTLSSASVTTDASSGIGTVDFTSSSAGTGTISGRVTAPALPAPPTSTVNVTTAPPPGAIELAPSGVQYDVMGVKGSGYREQNMLAVRVLDTNGDPYPAGLDVRFEHTPLAGSTLSLPQTGVACASPCVTVAATDAQGIARVNLNSGTRAGTLAVSASVASLGAARAIALPPVAVVGARASASAFTIKCDANVPALREHNCGVSLVDAEYACTAYLQDRYQNVLGTAIPVTFASETSRIGQVTSTPAYTGSTAGTADLGYAAQRFDTLGGYLPEDVDPNAGEPSSTYDDFCGTLTHNPRDGVVSVIAIADGEESFTDLNGNGVYDAGEPFVDLGEPFVDSDDDGVWTPGEWFEDDDHDGTWTPPNRVWDASTKIWTQTVVLYTGEAPAQQLTDDASGDLIGTRWIDPADWTGDACVATPAPPAFAVLAKRDVPDPSDPTKTITLPPTTDAYVVVGADGNLNPAAEDAAYSVAMYAPTGMSVTLTRTPTQPNASGLFFRYWPCDTASGKCATRCPAGTGGRCEMRASVGNFTCGKAGNVTLTGGDEPTGAEVAGFTQTYGLDQVTFPISGTNN